MQPGKIIIPNRSLGCYALTRFLIVICFAAFRSQWNPIARSKQQNICSINKGGYHHNANDLFGIIVRSEPLYSSDFLTLRLISMNSAVTSAKSVKAMPQ